MISLIEVYCYHGSYWITSKVLLSPSWLG